MAFSRQDALRLKSSGLPNREFRDMTTQDQEPADRGIDVLSVFGAMNVGHIEDLIEANGSGSEPIELEPVQIDLPEPDLRFSFEVPAAAVTPSAPAAREEAPTEPSEPDALVETPVDDTVADIDDIVVEALDEVDSEPEPEVLEEAVEVDSDEMPVDDTATDIDEIVVEVLDEIDSEPQPEVLEESEEVDSDEMPVDDSVTDIDEIVVEVLDEIDSEPEPEVLEESEEADPEGSEEAGEADWLEVQDEAAVPEQLARVEKLIVEIREDGHLAASIDPLGLRPRREDHLEPSKYGIYDSTLAMDAAWLARSEDDAYMWLTGPTVGDSIGALRGLYCGNVGYEFEHVHNVEERLWLHSQVESQSSVSMMSNDQRRGVLELLSKTEAFEQYLHRTFPGKRWYSLEGLDALMVLIDQIVLQSAFEVEQIVIGMTHRGRLNVSAHILEQPYDEVLGGFLEGRFAHLAALEASGWMTDVKYHLGSRTARDVNDDGTTDVVLRMLPNPSHLEMVMPGVLGAVRAMQDAAEDGVDRHMSAMALLVHGDAAFAGQGIVSESLNLMNLGGYDVGGAVHVIANNQIGFTTEVEDAFSGSYASDIARGFEVPVVHVNADDIEACATVAKMAVSYRSRFRKDFVIDLVGYRRHGHNENDDPSITQPTTYKAVQSQPTVRAKWEQKLVEGKLVTEDEAAAMLSATAERMDAVRNEIEASGEVEHHEVPANLGLTQEGMSGIDYGETAVADDVLREVNSKLLSVPEGFSVHQTVARVYERRAASFSEDGPPIDWSHAELLSFGTILNDGVNIRLTGQDVGRGTFSQRHAMLFDTESGSRHVPLDSFDVVNFWIFNSPLSEAGPMGFEHGYSVQSDSTLVLWEAQFGDFVNNAQSVIDEIVVSAEEKWGQSSSLVLLLPHGYEGQGPNHSHAHLERFLDLAARGNIRIAFPTTAVQYFHLLRTQAASLVSGENRHPLVIMSPKSLLRHPLAASPLSEFTGGRFRPVRRFMLGASDAKEVERVVLCTGKVFVDVASHPEVGSAKSVGVVVLEELYPFPGRQLEAAMSSFPNAKEAVWLQEEPMNRGAWDYVRSPIASTVGGRVRYVGRPRSPSPASGSNWLHRMQQDALLMTVLGLDPVAVAGE